MKPAIFNFSGMVLLRCKFFSRERKISDRVAHSAAKCLIMFCLGRILAVKDLNILKKGGHLSALTYIFVSLMLRCVLFIFFRRLLIIASLSAHTNISSM